MRAGVSEQVVPAKSRRKQGIEMGKKKSVDGGVAMVVGTNFTRGQLGGTPEQQREAFAKGSVGTPPPEQPVQVSVLELSPRILNMLTAAGLNYVSKIIAAIEKSADEEAELNHLTGISPFNCAKVLEAIAPYRSGLKAEGAETAAEEVDPLLEQAENIVRSMGVASITMIQRRLRISYARACDLVDAMKASGLVDENHHLVRKEEPKAPAKEGEDYIPTYAVTSQNVKPLIKGKPKKMGVITHDAKPAAAEGGEPAPALQHRYAMVNIDLIKIDGKNMRKRHTPEQDAELAESIATHGVLEPIGLRSHEGEGGERLDVIFGHRRLVAAKKAGLLAIPSLIYTYDANTHTGILRGVENFQRVPPTPMEEAEAVAVFVEQAEVEIANSGLFINAAPDSRVSIRNEAIKKTAKALGKSEDWVRRRAFLTRFGPEERELIESGLLPVEHAIEISKVADPSLRAKLAKESAAYDSDVSPKDLEEVKELVGQVLYRLDVVPWDLDKRFADRVACNHCSANSKNTPGLFTGTTVTSDSLGGIKVPAQGICTNQSCYKRKDEEAQRLASQAASRVMHDIRKVQSRGGHVPVVTQDMLAGYTPDGLKPAAVAAKTEQKIEAAKQREKKDAKKGKGPSFTKQDSAEMKAQQEHTNALWTRERKLRDLICKAVAKRPCAFAMMSMLVCSKPWNDAKTYGFKHEEKARAQLEALVKDICEGIEDGEVWSYPPRLVKAFDAKEINNMLFIESPPPKWLVLDKIGEALGVKLPPVPVLKLPQAPDPKLDKKAAAKKVPAKKKATKTCKGGVS